jgi:hypothetical protein
MQKKITGAFVDGGHWARARACVKFHVLIPCALYLAFHLNSIINVYCHKSYPINFGKLGELGGGGLCYNRWLAGGWLVLVWWGVSWRVDFWEIPEGRRALGDSFYAGKKKEDSCNI